MKKSNNQLFANPTPLAIPSCYGRSAPSNFESYPQFSSDNSTAGICCYDECLNCPIRIEDPLQMNLLGNLLCFTNPMFSWRCEVILWDFQSDSWLHSWAVRHEVSCLLARVFNSLSLSETCTNRMENITKNLGTQFRKYGPRNFSISTLFRQFFDKYASHV